jgi:hypothetical protein
MNAGRCLPKTGVCRAEERPDKRFQLAAALLKRRVNRLLQPVPFELCGVNPMPLVSQLRLALPLASLAVGAAAAQVAPAALELIGEDGASKTLTMADLAGLPQTDVIVTEPNGAKIVFRGPTLRALMTLVGAPTGHALRGPSMLLAVLAEAADGYRVAYMLAEVDEQFGARTAILALTQNEHPLPPRDGPLRVVVAP